MPPDTGVTSMEDFQHGNAWIFDSASTKGLLRRVVTTATECYSALSPAAIGESCQVSLAAIYRRDWE
jgi:hypothetical protein